MLLLCESIPKKISMKKLSHFLGSCLDFRIERYLDVDDFHQNDVNWIDEHMAVYRLFDANDEQAVSSPYFEYDVVDDKIHSPCQHLIRHHEPKKQKNYLFQCNIEK